MCWREKAALQANGNTEVAQTLQLVHSEFASVVCWRPGWLVGSAWILWPLFAGAQGWAWFLAGSYGAIWSLWGFAGVCRALLQLCMAWPWAPHLLQVHGRVGWDEEELHSAQPELMNPHWCRRCPMCPQSCASVLGSGNAQPGSAQDCLRSVKLTDLQQQCHF